MARPSTIAAMPVADRMTADEFLAMDDPRRGLQLIDGEVVVNEPRQRHQYLQGETFALVREWVLSDQGSGDVSLPIDVKVDDYNVYAPDVLWYADENPDAPQGLDPDPPYAMPDLAVEVRSPSTWRYDVGRKKAEYERHGLRELWLVDGQADTVLVFRRSTPGAPGFDVALEAASGQTLASPLLPGFTLDLRALFGR